MARGPIFSPYSQKTIKNEERLNKLKAKHFKILIEKGEIKRPKVICSSCFEIHLEDVPENCWIKGLSGDISNQIEFAKYIKQNKKGRIE
jgi:hypothetical protein